MALVGTGPGVFQGRAAGEEPGPPRPSIWLSRALKGCTRPGRASLALGWAGLKGGPPAIVTASHVLSARPLCRCGGDVRLQGQWRACSTGSDASFLEGACTVPDAAWARTV